MEEKVQVTIIEKNEERIRFLLGGVKTSWSNALRREMLASVPTLAIDDVKIFDNSSLLTDHVLADRVGLIPLKCSKQIIDKFKFPSECDCASKTCNDCAVIYELKVTNQKDEILSVTSADLKPVQVSQNTILPMDNDILLAKIVRGQSIHLQAISVKGRPQTHAKWASCSEATAVYESDVLVAEVEIQAGASIECKQAVVSSCPKRVFKFNPEQAVIEIEDAQRCVDCGSCTKELRKWKEKETTTPANLVQIKHKPNKFMLTIETVGSLTPAEIMFSALDCIENRLDNTLQGLDVSDTQKRLRSNGFSESSSFSQLKDRSEDTPFV
jgi:DNA-directed RNA polymerase subunit D